jgi:hypothetical protein
LDLRPSGNHQRIQEEGLEPAASFLWGRSHYRCGRDCRRNHARLQGRYGHPYNGIWGYASLIVTLANTNEVLYLVNRPGNRPSCDGAAEWMDRAIDFVGNDLQGLVAREHRFLSDPLL